MSKSFERQTEIIDLRDKDTLSRRLGNMAVPAHIFDLYKSLLLSGQLEDAHSTHQVLEQFYGIQKS